ncbi:flagellar biosynthetic protein FliO [Clostridiisalibacter paucivorans]|uniref:flagellar biosynthetic protein FliO n=1 Tax=Clostridiisalibacter paucivorans TaxID=408753 RepID=UPI000479F920|nr:flagellar biosynthetic protein FliO [Clostridiisalibacter paucivorans]
MVFAFYYGESQIGYIFNIILYIIFFIVILFLAYIFTKFLAKRSLTSKSTGNIKVLEYMMIDNKNKIVLLYILGKYYAVMIGEKNFEVIDRYEDGEVEIKHEGSNKDLSYSFKEYLKAYKLKKQNVFKKTNKNDKDDTDEE